jgi:class 3 adenylate cyclase
VAARASIGVAEDWREARLTAVLHLEHGDWKVVLNHLSFPQPNKDALGASLTVSLEQLEEAVRQQRPDLATSLASDGTVTIVFTDIVDSTVLNARLGDHAWRDALRRHRALVDAATSAHGGTVVQTVGDGSMLAFSSARRAVACAQEIQLGTDQEFGDASPPVRVRIGAHTGEAVREGNDFFGTTLNYAARVASHALGGEVVVSSLVRDLVLGGTGLEFREGRDVELKGFPGLHRLFPVDLR